MKLQVAITILATFISLNSHANWYVEGVSCLKDRNDGTQNADGFSVHGTTLEKYTVVPEPGNAPPNRIPDGSDFLGTYDTLTKINPRTVWTGVFDWTPIYDGMNLENGRVGPINGVTIESRTEIRFKPFTDLAYGPDYATINIYTRKPGETQWALKSGFPECWVTVYH